MIFDLSIAGLLVDPSARLKDVGMLMDKYSNSGASSDPRLFFSVRERLEKTLKDTGVRKVLDDIEHPLIPALFQLERNGILIDRTVLYDIRVKIKHDMAELETEIFSLVGQEFNINSPKQLQVILFEKLNLPVLKRTKTGPSTDADVLEQLSVHHDLPKKVLLYRELQKLLSTYIETLPTLINPANNRIHTTLNQIGAATGRMSSTNPNLQNIPIRTEMGREIRKSFIAAPGTVILSADYSQIELRLFAHIADDQNMINAFARGEDIHTATAAKVFHLELKEVTPLQRRFAKTINFGLMYGMGAFSLSRDLGVKVEEAKTFITEYFASFPRIREYIDRCIEQCKKDGYVSTLFGRRRWITEINSPNRTMEELGKREAVNSVIQGSAADIIKLAMIKIARHLEEEKLGTKMILQVHDELLFEVPVNELEKAKSLIKKDMESVVDLRVPMVVEIGTGPSWFEAH